MDINQVIAENHIQIDFRAVAAEVAIRLYVLLSKQS